MTTAASPATDVRHAPWSRRVVAYLIDSAILAVIPLIMVAVALLMTAGSQGTDEPGPLGVTLMVAGVLVNIGLLVWNRGLRQGRTGRSVGKSVVGLRLLDERTSSPVGGGTAIWRDFVHVLDSSAAGLGYLWPLWDAKRQTFADKILHTVVLDDSSA